MKPFWNVFSYTFKDRVFSKMFILTTIFILIAEAIFLSIPRIQELFDDENKPKVVVVENNSPYHLTEKVLNDSIPGFDWKVDTYQQIESLKEEVKEETYAGMFVISSDEKVEVDYFTNLEDQQLKSLFSNFLQSLNTALFIVENQVSQESASQILTPVQIETNLVTKDKMQSFIIIYAMIFFTYIGILVYGQSVATSITTEKSSRVMEIMITKVKPLHMMFGKIFGVAIASLLQIVIAVIGAVLLTKSGISGKDTELLGIDFSFKILTMEQVIYFILFFMLGYFLYASIYAIIGAIVSRTEDLNTASLPVGMLIILAFVLSLSALMSPNGMLAKILSFVPFSSSIAMFIRVSLTEVPFYQILLSILILLAFIIVFSLLAARIYPSSVLNYSNKLNLIKALKMSSQNKNDQQTKYHEA